MSESQIRIADALEKSGFSTPSVFRENLVGQSGLRPQVLVVEEASEYVAHARYADSTKVLLFKIHINNHGFEKDSYKLLAACLMLVSHGCFTTELVKMLPFKPVSYDVPVTSDTLDFYPKGFFTSMEGFVRTYLINLPVGWYTWNMLPFDGIGKVVKSDALLHRVFYERQYVKRLDVSTFTYVTLLEAVGSLGTDKLFAASEGMISPSFLKVLSKMLSYDFSETDMKLWVIATCSSELLNSDQVSLRRKMAISGDASLKAVTAAALVESTYSPGDVSSVLTSKHTNAHMSAMFAASPLALHVYFGSNITLGRGRVGADFLEAIAYMVDKHAPRQVLRQYASVMGIM